MSISGNSKLNLSGQIEVKNIVQELMKQEQKPLQQLQKKQDADIAQLNAFTQLDNLLSAFQTQVQNLTTTFNANYSVTSSDTTAINAQIIGNNALPITHSMTVSQLAQAESIASDPFGSATSALNKTDTITFTIGSENFNVNVVNSDTLQNICDKINSGATLNNIGVTAKVVSVAGNQFQLVVSSNQTGLDNKVTIGESMGNPLGLTHELTAAQDSEFTFDTLDMEESTNHITDAADGLSFTLLSTVPADEPVSLIVHAITPSPEVSKAGIQNVLDSYNQVIGFIDQVQADPSARNNIYDYVKTNLMNIFTSATTGPEGFQKLSDVGIVFAPPQAQKTTITVADKYGDPTQKIVDYVTSGKLEIDTNANLISLTSLLSTDFSSVRALLINSTDGIFTQVNHILNPLTGSIPKQLSSSMTVTSRDAQKLDQEILQEKDKLKKIEDDLTLKYSALNVTLQKFHDMSDYLKRQMDGMNSYNKG